MKEKRKTLPKLLKTAATSERKQSIKVNVIENSGASEVALILKKESHDPQCQKQLSSFVQPRQQNTLKHQIKQGCW